MKKKGFTLIELLAVIIILAVIALIATPIVLDVVESAKKSSFESSAYGMVDAMKLKSAEDMIKGNTMAKEYTFPNNDLDVQGSQLTGTGSVDSQGRIQMAVNNGKWCATKSYSEGIITVKEYVEGECIVSVEETVYNPSDYLKIKVGPNEEDVYNFYVLKDNGDTITAILDRNIGDNIHWGNPDDTTPTIAETQIATLETSWTNVGEVRLPYVEELISQTEWYKGLTDEQKADWENEYMTYFHSDMILEVRRAANQDCGESNKCFREALAAYEETTGEDSILLPTWLDINLYTSGDSTEDSKGYPKIGYWTKDVVSDIPVAAWHVNYYGHVDFMDFAMSDAVGVRPVITIDESYIIAELDAPEYVDSGFTRE